MTERTKLRYRVSLEASARGAAAKMLPEIPWIVRLIGGDKLIRALMLAFVEGCEWQDDQKYGD